MSANLDKENQLPKGRGAMRGKAALLLDSSSEEEDDTESRVGIYSTIIKSTIQEREQNKQKHALVESEWRLAFCWSWNGKFFLLPDFFRAVEKKFVFLKFAKEIFWIYFGKAMDHILLF